MANKLPKAVLFDNDGTFLDTEAAWARAEVKLFERRQLVFSDEHRKHLIGTSFDVAAIHLENFLGQPGEGKRIMDELARLVHEELNQGAPPMPGAEELVDALKQRGVGVAIVTNADRRFVTKALEVAGHSETFDVVLTSDDVERPKPSPLMYLAAVKHFGVNPEECFVIEDSRTGVAAGVAAQIPTVGVSSHPEVDLTEATYRFDSLTDPKLWSLLGLS